MCHITKKEIYDIVYYMWGCLTSAQKQSKNAFLVFFGHFWTYVGQPHGHIGWAILMPFASFNSTNPRITPLDFDKKYLELSILKNDLFFASSPWKLVTNYVLEWMGLNFYDYDGLQPKTTPPKHISRQCKSLFFWGGRSFSKVHISILRTPLKFDKNSKLY